MSCHAVKSPLRYSAKMDTISVTTGSRLHFGPLSWKSTVGPNFGGIGMMIDQPQTVVKAAAASEFSVTGPSEAVDKIEQLFSHWQQLTSIRAAIRVVKWADRHQGFGSGTQLACAATMAILSIEESEDSPSQMAINPARLAEWGDRGERSAIGLHGFLHGGFLADAGRCEQDRVGALAARHDFPSDWVILLDRCDGVGISGLPESAAFQSLAAMPEAITHRLSDLALRSIMYGLAARNFAVFAASLTEYGRIAGRFFQSVQGGEFADPSWNDRSHDLQAVATAAVVQSSWGPTVAVIAETDADAIAIQSAYPDRNWQKVAPQNEGFHVKRLAYDDSPTAS